MRNNLMASSGWVGRERNGFFGDELLLLLLLLDGRSDTDRFASLDD